MMRRPEPKVVYMTEDDFKRLARPGKWGWFCILASCPLGIAAGSLLWHFAIAG
jgi:hypothetical protein